MIQRGETSVLRLYLVQFLSYKHYNYGQQNTNVPQLHQQLTKPNVNAKVLNFVLPKTSAIITCHSLFLA